MMNGIFLRLSACWRLSDFLSGITISSLALIRILTLCFTLMISRALSAGRVLSPLLPTYSLIVVIIQTVLFCPVALRKPATLVSVQYWYTTTDRPVDPHPWS